MLDRLKDELKDLPDNFVVLTIFPDENYEQLNMHMIEQADVPAFSRPI